MGEPAKLCEYNKPDVPYGLFAEFFEAVKFLSVKEMRKSVADM